MRTIIIPMYNGRAHLLGSLKELESLCSSSNHAYHVVCVDDGSTDGSYAFLEHLQRESKIPMTVVQLPTNRGKGYAIQEGVRHVPFDSTSIAFTDVDVPYGVAALEQGFDLVEQGFEFVYGSRTEAGKKQRQYSLYRKMGAFIFRLLLPVRVRKISDTQSGLKVFSRSAATILFPLIRTGRWVFDIELFLIAEARGIPSRELPVTLKASSITGRGGVRILKHGLKILGDIIKIRFYAIRGVYTKSR